MKISLSRTIVCVLLSLLLPAGLLAWPGKVIGISDGDSLTVLKGNKRVQIRLYGIDCPEAGQAFAKKAKQFTATLAYGNNVEVEPVDMDVHGRTVAWVYVDGKSLNKALVKAGLAWHYKRHSSHECLAELERQARDKKRGLWSAPHAMAPWNYRRLKRNDRRK
jgi:endonuclease YncB( thermonuclease family)